MSSVTRICTSRGLHDGGGLPQLGAEQEALSLLHSDFQEQTCLELLFMGCNTSHHPRTVIKLTPDRSQHTRLADAGRKSSKGTRT